MAFLHFAEENVDIAIIETGLGGRLDSTNVVHPILSLITNISLDHTSLLGNTLEAIAYEKAGIIKHNTPVVISEKAEATSSVFLDKAASTQSKITFASDQWKIETLNKEEESLFLQAKIGREHV